MAAAAAAAPRGWAQTAARFGRLQCLRVAARAAPVSISWGVGAWCDLREELLVRVHLDRWSVIDGT